MSVKEQLPEPSNPLGIDGLEFVEYATSQPQSFGALLQNMGFAAVARHRSREVMLYRQGPMNLIVNAYEAKSTIPMVSAFALRVRDAASAHQHALELGAWDMPTRASAMELNIPGIHGVGDSLLYFVDRYRDFSIYDVDFTLNPGVDAHPPALANLHWFGLVQYIGSDRMEDWTEFYETLFGFTALPDEQRYGILPKGRILLGPCGRFHLQLIDPKPGIFDIEPQESLQRIGFGTPDVLSAVKALRQRGIGFVESQDVHSEARGALTQPYLGGVMFELVHDERR